MANTTHQAVIATVLSDLDTEVLSAALLALTYRSNVKIDEINLAYKPFLEKNLIKENGATTFDEEDMVVALGYTIMRRLKNA